MYTESVKVSTNWTRENLAWLAGIIEGEGTMRWTKPAPKRDDGRHPGGQSLDLSIAMTDEDVLRRVAEIAGVGKVFGPYQPKPETRKPIFTYKVSGANAYAVLAAVFSWLHSRRREQVLTAIKSWTQSHPKRALAADQVAAIKSTYAMGSVSMATLGAEYGVSASTISNVVSGKMYKWA